MEIPFIVFFFSFSFFLFVSSSGRVCWFVTSKLCGVTDQMVNVSEVALGS